MFSASSFEAITIWLVPSANIDLLCQNVVCYKCYTKVTKELLKISRLYHIKLLNKHIHMRLYYVHNSVYHFLIVHIIVEIYKTLLLYQEQCRMLLYMHLFTFTSFDHPHWSCRFLTVQRRKEDFISRSMLLVCYDFI